MALYEENDDFSAQHHRHPRDDFVLSLPGLLKLVFGDSADAVLAFAHESPAMAACAVVGAILLPMVISYLVAGLLGSDSDEGPLVALRIGRKRAGLAAKRAKADADQFEKATHSLHGGHERRTLDNVGSKLRESARRVLAADHYHSLAERIGAVGKLVESRPQPGFKREIAAIASACDSDTPPFARLSQALDAFHVRCAPIPVPERAVDAEEEEQLYLSKMVAWLDDEHMEMQIKTIGSGARPSRAAGPLTQEDLQARIDRLNRDFRP
ncbi:hypothetical protein DIPPA_29471 [Diplonema papillatum]|nr:hypothetical protein DIPPA_29471 [Diplonema papillatum]